MEPRNPRRKVRSFEEALEIVRHRYPEAFMLGALAARSFHVREGERVRGVAMATLMKTEPFRIQQAGRPHMWLEFGSF